MFQVLVKTSPHMQGSYSLIVEDIGQARAFAARPDVWWYSFPSELEDGDWSWRRGGAWTATAEQQAEAVATDLQSSGGRLLKPVPQEVTDEPGDDDDEDGRW